MIAEATMNHDSIFGKLITWPAIAALVLLPDAGPSLRAQDAATTIAVDVKEVTLPVTVRDKHAKIVRDLTKDDFTLQEDGRPQAIKYYSQDANLALTLGLLVDTSRSQTNVLDAERNASRSFLDQIMVQEKKKAGPQGDHNFVGWHRPRQQDFSGRRDRVGPARRYFCLLHLLCG